MLVESPASTMQDVFLIASDSDLIARDFFIGPLPLQKCSVEARSSTRSISTATTESHTGQSWLVVV